MARAWSVPDIGRRSRRAKSRGKLDGTPWTPTSCFHEIHIHACQYQLTVGLRFAGRSAGILDVNKHYIEYFSIQQLNHPNKQQLVTARKM
jgi:hypothetical protein